MIFFYFFYVSMASCGESLSMPVFLLSFFHERGFESALWGILVGQIYLCTQDASGNKIVKAVADKVQSFFSNTLGVKLDDKQTMVVVAVLMVGVLSAFRRFRYESRFYMEFVAGGASGAGAIGAGIAGMEELGMGIVAAEVGIIASILNPFLGIFGIYL